SGKVIVEDVNGEFKKGFILDEGRQVQEFIPSSQSGRTSTVDCYIIAQYYSCVSVPSMGLYAECQWMYNDYSCYTSGGGGGGGGYSVIVMGGFNSYGGGGGNFPRPYIGEYPDNLHKIYKLSSTLDAAQKFLVNEILFFYLKHCFGSIVYANIVASGMKFNFSVNPSIPGRGAYNPINNDFIFQDNEAIVGDVFVEEIFHAYQNTVYGTTQYLGQNTPGRVNIEFEAWLMKDIAGMTAKPGTNTESQTICCRASSTPEYFNWLLDMTTQGTKWPTWEQLQPKYYYFMEQFRNTWPQYSSPIVYNLQPTAMLHAATNSSCPK
ncbi:hypothetical protein, partial [Dyadobacter sp. LHD-138]|uniref:hypothetical protein n=1 Tax=Dyadobacter sp. LHD-138 TaxID=3071413 RepID=UPI0027E1BB34